MGQTLSEPVTAKKTTSVSNETMKVGASCMQGWRISMEDAHTHILSLIPDDPSASFFAVFDGHGGHKVAHYAGENLHHILTSMEDYKRGNYEEALKQAFLRCDELMLDEPSLKDEMAGATAITMLIKDQRLYIANAGDSRAVSSINGVADALSIDHKPSNEVESKRIINAGGWVEFNRVNGNLALSRALGDFVFKRNEKKDMTEQIVTSYPEVQVRELNPDIEFVVLACDGIWDVLTNQEVVDFVRLRISKGMEPQQICEELMTRCLAPDCGMGGLGCDNMTVILICYVNGGSYSELAAKCSVPKPVVSRNRSSTNEMDSEAGSPASSHDSSASTTPDIETHSFPAEDDVADDGAIDDVPNIELVTPDPVTAAIPSSAEPKADPKVSD